MGDEFRGNSFTVTLIGRIIDDDSDDYTLYYLVEFDPDTRDEWVLAPFWHREFEKEFFPTTHCHHDYDCCGNFYATQGWVGVVGLQVLVHQRWCRNV